MVVSLGRGLFLVASVTDYFDGYLARRNKSVSDFGKILDPLADKLMVASALIMLAAIDRPHEPSVPAWLVVVVLARETAVTVFAASLSREGIVMQAETLGKYKFILQAFAVVGLLVHYDIGVWISLPRDVFSRALLGDRLLVGDQLSRAVFSPSTSASEPRLTPAKLTKRYHFR